MATFNNIPWKFKLILGFLFLSIIVALVGYIGIKNIQKINFNGSQIYSNNLLAINDLNTIRETFLKSRSESLMLFYNHDQIQNESVRQELKAITSQNEKAESAYEKAFLDSLSDEKRMYYTYFKKLQTNYYDEQAKMTQLIDDGNYQVAEDMIQNMIILNDNALSNLNKLIEINTLEAEQRNSNNHDLYLSTLKIQAALVILSVLLALLIGIYLARNLAKRLNMIMVLAEAFGEGDLTKQVKIKGKDEIGRLGLAFNKALINVKEILIAIGNSSQIINSQSEKLSAAMKELMDTMHLIKSSTVQIAHSTDELSAAIQEISASTEEIGNSTTTLVFNAGEGQKSALAIRDRAGEIKTVGTNASYQAQSIYKEKKANISKALEQAKVVDKIKLMAETISGIADQTNLLSLNASIEAARAGTAGRGFAVVAGEVRKLAEQSHQAVDNIHSVIGDVQKAFEQLMLNTNDLLDFIEIRVNTDYQAYVQTGIQYEEDSQFISTMSNEFAETASLINQTLIEINSAMQQVASTTEETSASSEDISESVAQTVSTIEQITRMAQEQTDLVSDLNRKILKFTCN